MVSLNNVCFLISNFLLLLICSALNHILIKYFCGSVCVCVFIYLTDVRYKTCFVFCKPSDQPATVFFDHHVYIFTVFMYFVYVFILCNFYLNTVFIVFVSSFFITLRISFRNRKYIFFLFYLFHDFEPEKFGQKG